MPGGQVHPTIRKRAARMVPPPENLATAVAVVSLSAAPLDPARLPLWQPCAAPVPLAGLLGAAAEWWSNGALRTCMWQPARLVESSGLVADTECKHMRDAASCT